MGVYAQQGMKPLLWDSFILRDFRLTKRYDFAIAGAAYDSKTRSVDTTGKSSGSS